MRPCLFVVAASLSLAAAEPPKLRIGDEIRPVQYAADLTMIPGNATFNGSIDIDAALSRPASLVWLNVNELTLQKASVSAAGTTQSAAIESGDADFIGLRPPAALPAGPVQLHIEYKGKISDKHTAGVFQGKDGGETYLFTQFESIDARRAFPCFDQPDFKTPWQLTLHVRKSDTAISNTPPVSETDEPGGMKRVVFAKTKPLPSYLVALAVGPFDIVDAGKTGRNRVPVRIITPKGKAGQAKYAAEVTATIIQRLEDYFGVPFPYEKIDNVAVPLTFGFGAMENAGMVTYEQNLILSDPSIDTIQRQRGYASVAAHELAHQWVGDLVTTAWWDDIWLNEAFATWMAAKILAEWQPAWNTRLNDLQAKFGAMGNDSLVTARQIRQPIESKNDIANAFDGITYTKGASVIRMFESWAGERQFQKGVNVYLNRYAFKNARAGDVLDAVSSAANPKLTAAFSTFLEQPGLPEVSVDLKCDGAPRVALSQKRYLPIGSTGGNRQVWQTPVCVRYPGRSGPQSECFLLDKPAAEFRLTKANACPAYISANDSSSGYYVAAYQGDLFAKLLAHNTDFLSDADRLTLLRDLNMLAEAGDVKESRALEAAQAFAAAPERHVSGQARTIVDSASRLLPDDLQANYVRFVRKLFGAQAAALGWSAKPGDDAETRLLRTAVVPFVARRGDDTALLAEARRLADGWLRDRKGVDPDMLRFVLSTAAWAGGQDFFDTLLRELKKTEDLQQRQVMIGALGSFRNPQIARQSLDLMLASDLDVKEGQGVFFGPLGNRETEKLTFEFVKANYDALLKRLPIGGGFDARSMLPFSGAAFCDESSRQQLVAFFQDRVKDYLGGPRNYAQVLESIRLCEARRAAQTADVTAFFARW